nr:amidohydrolase family protein [Erythrobacter ramosus]
MLGGAAASVATSMASSSGLAGNATRPFDLVIRGGLVVDGTGAPKRPADIGIVGGRIAMIGKANPATRATRIIDVQGKVVTPSFIDPHAHGDPLQDTSFANFLTMGVTTITLGQDGETPGYHHAPDPLPSMDLAAWRAASAATGLSLNIAPLVGHGTLRWRAGVDLAAVPSATQLATMRRLLDADLVGGAFGLSSGLEYVPGIYSETPELVALAQTVGARRGVVMSHMRSEDDDKIEGAIDELIAQGRYAHVHISHLKVVLGKAVERGQAILEKIARARAEGIDLTADVYPYNGGYADITLVFPLWAKTADQLAVARRDRGTELADFVRARIVKRNGPDAILIAEGPYAGQTLAQAAAKADKPFWQFAIEDLGANPWNCAHFTQDEAIQELFAASPLVAISTDGAPWISHPRSWATYPKVLGEFVRERNLLTLEAAIYKMTGLAAHCVGLTQRGRIAVGLAADLVVFDPATIAPQATWTAPRAPAVGIDYVIVDGALAVERGEVTGARSGRILKRGRS